MKSLMLLVLSLFCCLPGFAQQITLSGQVTIHNSRYTTGQLEPVQHVYISAPGGGSDDTDVNGRFQLVFVNVPAGTIVPIQVQKHGYEVVNPGDLQIVVGRKTPLHIYLAPPAQLNQARAELYEVSLQALTARYQRQIARLRQDDREGRAELARIEQQLGRQLTDRLEAERLLTDQLQALQRQLPELVEQLALQNLDFASDLYLQAYEYLRSGETAKAVATLDEARLDAQAQEAITQTESLSTGIEALQEADHRQQARMEQTRRRSLLDWDCQFSRCNTALFGRYDRNFYWEVAGAEYDDLSTKTQGVCAVELYFDHHFASDLEIQLISPAGQMVTLVRVDLPNDTTHAAQWAIRFVSCDQLASPDPKMSALFDDNYWPPGQRFTGTYYPAGGCLDALDAGPVNGRWTLRVSHRGTRGMGYLHGFKIVFWRQEGLYCTGLYQETTRTKPENRDEPLPRDPRRPDPAAAADAAAKAFRDQIVQSARDLIGAPYLYGGKNRETGFDCSNFTRFNFNQNGVEGISPSSARQSTQGRFVWLDQVQPADLLFFGDEHHIQHVALISRRTPDGIICIHSTSSRGVIEENVTKSPYWNHRILFARDVISNDDF